MEENVKIPKVIDTGSAGTQSASIDSVVPAPSQPLEGLHLAKTIDGLAANNSRSMGGEVVSALIAASTNQLAHELSETKKELKEERKKNEGFTNNMANIKIDNAVLKERINGEGKNKHLRNLSILIGSVIISIGIELQRNNFEKYPFIFYGLGSVLLLLGWFSGPKETR